MCFDECDFQKYLEILDGLKAENARPIRYGGSQVGLIVSQQQQRTLLTQQQREQRNFSNGQLMLTSKWEKY